MGLDLFVFYHCLTFDTDASEYRPIVCRRPAEVGLRLSAETNTLIYIHDTKSPSRVSYCEIKTGHGTIGTWHYICTYDRANTHMHTPRTDTVQWFFSDLIL